MLITIIASFQNCNKWTIEKSTFLESSTQNDIYKVFLYHKLFIQTVTLGWSKVITLSLHAQQCRSIVSSYFNITACLYTVCVRVKPLANLCGKIYYVWILFPFSIQVHKIVLIVYSRKSHFVKILYRKRKGKYTMAMENTALWLQPCEGRTINS